MPTVFDLVRSAGSIPLDELKVLSSETPEAVQEAVKTLQQDGLIELQNTDNAEVIKLTKSGFREAMS